MDENDFPAAEPLPPAPPHTKVQSPKRRWLKWVIIVIVILLIAGGAYFVFLKSKPKKTTPATQATQQTATQTPSQPAPVDTTAVNYKSTKLSLEFTHPQSWTVTEDDSGIVIKSPSQTYQTGGKSTQGPFRMVIKQGVAIGSPDYTIITNAKAVMDSLSIKYTAPTDAQRVFSNISFLGNGTDTFNFLLVTSDQTFKKGQAVGNSYQIGSDVLIIAGGYGGTGTNMQFDPVPVLGIDQNQPPLSQAIDLIKSLKLS